jgi:hypothetical protein
VVVRGRRQPTSSAKGPAAQRGVQATLTGELEGPSVRDTRPDRP